MHVWGIKLLRISLGIVYFWFGMLKLWNVSPIDDLIHAVCHFLNFPAICYVLGAFETLLGIGLIFNIKLRLVLILTALQLLSTFGSLLLAPSLFFEGGNPLTLSLYGEFLAKNLVLVAAVITLWGYSANPKPAH